jgi:hypothetical protein
MPSLRSEHYNAFKPLPSTTMGCRRLAIAKQAAENPARSNERFDNGRLPGWQGQGEVPVRPGILGLLIVVAACSSGTTPVPPSDPQASAALLKKDCEDPKWKEENLGLWYSVCRQPLHW